MEGNPWPAAVSHVQVWPVGSNFTGNGITVFSESGKKVSSHLLWTAEGEPIQVLFDTLGGENAYYVYPNGDTPTPTAWQPEAGLILETRRRAEGPMDSWAQVKELWDRSAPVLGRSPVSMINLGIHPHGPSKNFLSFFQGHLVLAEGGDYRFATVSTDASFLLIEGALVAQWPGPHDTGPGIRGEHQGTVRLEAGRHGIHYYHVHGAGDAVAVAAWQPPGTNRFSVIPAESFLPLGRFHAAAMDTASSQPPAVYFEWASLNHCMAQEMALVNVNFTALSDSTNLTYRWTFDDAATATGKTVCHLFPRPGIRSVTLEVFSQNTLLGNATRKVSVHPLWTQREEWPANLFEKQKAELSTRNLSTLPIDDLAYLTQLALLIEDRPWASQLGATCFQRKNELPREQIELFYKLGFHYQHPDVRNYPMAEAAFQAVLRLNPTNEGLREKTKLRQVELWMNRGHNPDEVMTVLNGIAAHQLTNEGQRLKRILEAEASLIKGNAEKALTIYLSLGPIAEKPFQTLKRRADLESAKQYLIRKDYDAAAELITRIEWERPIERMSAETELAMIAIHKARREYPFALARCQKLLNIPTLHEKDRADALLQLIDLHKLLGNTALAEQVYARLLSDHPYTEAAARARDQFGR